MYNKTMGRLECLAHGFKTMCKANIFWGDNSMLCFFVDPHYFLQIIKFLLFYCFVRFEDYNISPILDCFCGQHLFWLTRNFFFINKNNITKVILFFILCYKISPTIFTITIFFADMLQTLHHVTRSLP